MTEDTRALRTLDALPDELILHILSFLCLDVNDLLSASRASHRLRTLSLDPTLHVARLRCSHNRVGYLLPQRPALHSLQPPASMIYLTRTHLAARRLHWSLVCIRLNRSLSRRPKLSTLVSTNIVPKECCRIDRTSGDFVWGAGVAGALVETKRKVEREQIKEGLRVWLERKARQIRTRREEGGVGIMVWRLSRKIRISEAQRQFDALYEKPRKEKVSGLKRFFEGLGSNRTETV
ncbi:hypothetical protein CLAFUW4_00053 [Fulvia fulva]|uniref:F-box domain-containing protein n=1 Tax=Passalora fulva TaxID=5499 RepID=A0A9Q8L881_PASFU|nr:uncharacterized protein CLAFUR5_00051 [Fulvia fulva]KAK4634500.1 hypothetical protein CLAFUR4_00052 [Fulvia fulva]KAK4636726.1 hypothetical protein CLAFUR0_00051 [Fulvia fulva]UJO12634.1 hypothetical protein CLAFUR5_00051 [Fulvia fulva]WPV08289.1 hypothetical protein CLAFUW4_00053 [Fulvia fulva]WPV24643.1 hypothetical protein CLAFUW7_00053 [Fulvia fulva]